MFEQVSGTLAQAVDELEIPVERGALTSCFGLLDRFSAKLAGAVAEFDAAGAWRDDGATSMVAWLRHSVRMSSRDASRWTRTARRLAELPVTAAAYREGALSTGQVQAIIANLNDDTTPLFEQAETKMIPKLAGLGVRDVSQVMQSWATAAKDHLQPDPGDDDEPDSEPAGPQRSLHLSETMDGRGEMSASLDPEGRALTETAIRLAQTDDSDTEPQRSPAQRRGDAFVDIMRFFLDHQTDKLGGRHRPHLNIVVDYENVTDGCPCPHCPGHDRKAHGASNPGTGATGPGLDFGIGNPGTPPDLQPARHRGGRLLDGTTLDAATIRRLACDAGIHRVVMAGRSSILDYGWTTRTPPPNLFAAVVIRDRTCRFPGCDRPPKWCDAHHIHPWEEGGPTSIDNLALFCSRHHHLLHTPGWHCKLRSDGTIEITDPDGRTHTTHPPGHLYDLFDERPAAA